jgi:hypothetical protein
MKPPPTLAPGTDLHHCGEETKTPGPAETLPASPTSKANPAQAQRQSPKPTLQKISPRRVEWRQNGARPARLLPAHP